MCYIKSVCFFYLLQEVKKTKQLETYTYCIINTLQKTIYVGKWQEQIQTPKDIKNI